MTRSLKSAAESLGPSAIGLAREQRLYEAAG
jgi:hypothetical protein